MQIINMPGLALVKAYQPHLAQLVILATVVIRVLRDLHLRGLDAKILNFVNQSG